MRANQFINEDWNKVNKHDKTDGLSQKAVNAYRRENPGSKLQTAVTTKPSKLKAGSKDAKRRKSFCARMSGNKGPMKKPNGKPTPKALALRRWNCESVEEMRQLIEHAQREIIEEKIKQRLDPKCWKGYKKQGTKVKGNTRVNNCVKIEEAATSVTNSIVAAGSKARQAFDAAVNSIPRPFDEKEVANDLKNQGSAQKTAQTKPKSEAANPAQQAAIAIAKKKKAHASK